MWPLIRTQTHFVPDYARSSQTDTLLLTSRSFSGTQRWPLHSCRLRNRHRKDLPSWWRRQKCSRSWCWWRRNKFQQFHFQTPGPSTCYQSFRYDGCTALSRSLSKSNELSRSGTQCLKLESRLSPEAYFIFLRVHLWLTGMQITKIWSSF